MVLPTSVKAKLPYKLDKPKFEAIHGVPFESSRFLCKGREKILRIILVNRRIDNARRDGVDAYALFCAFHCPAPRHGLKAASRDHRDRTVYSTDRVIHRRRRYIDDASAGLLSQHLLDRELAD